MRIESVGKGGVAANVDGEIAKYGAVKCVDYRGCCCCYCCCCCRVRRDYLGEDEIVPALNLHHILDSTALRHY